MHTLLALGCSTSPFAPSASGSLPAQWMGAVAGYPRVPLPLQLRYGSKKQFTQHIFGTICLIHHIVRACIAVQCCQKLLQLQNAYCCLLQRFSMNRDKKTYGSCRAITIMPNTSKLLPGANCAVCARIFLSPCPSLTFGQGTMGSTVGKDWPDALAWSLLVSLHPSCTYIHSVIPIHLIKLMKRVDRVESIGIYRQNVQQLGVQQTHREQKSMKNT
jgi:hypothetical protein